MSEGARPRPTGGPSYGERRLAEETRERFLREIVARVPLDRLAAVHLFRPIRQGGFESGVAVVAAELPAVPVADGSVEPVAGPATVGAASVGEAAVAVVAADGEDAAPPADVEPGADAIGEPPSDPTDAAAGPGEGPAEDVAEGAAESTTESSTESSTEAPDETPGTAASPDAAQDVEPVEDSPPAAEARHTRHTVFTARYRLAIKGPDRGKWDVEVVEEADAPMVTVEAVVRGVQRRAGDEGDPPERLDAAAVARLVGAPRGAAAP